MVTSVQNDVANIIGRVKGLLDSSGKPMTLLPLAHNSKWNTLRTCAGGSPKVESGRYHFWLQAIRGDEMRVMDDHPTVIQAEEKKDAAHFWQCSHRSKGLRLKLIKTQAHVRPIR